MGSFGSFFLTMCLLTACLQAAPIVLNADNNDGHDSPWRKRYEAGTNSWGLEGHKNGQVERGDIWFNTFPGDDGTYRVKFGVVEENDGDPKYKVSAGSRTLGEGRYAWGGGCGGGTRAKYYDLGEHRINKGEKINVWGESVYHCENSEGWHGAYTRWFELVFESTGGSSEDTSPPSLPTNLSQTSATAASVTLSWNASTDTESGVSSYKVFVDGSQAKETSAAFTTVTGLSAATDYSVYIKAVNGAGLESTKSTTITVSTASTTVPDNVFFLDASSGLAIDGMQKKTVNGTLAPQAVWGTQGDLNAITDDISRALYSIEIPEDGTWYIWTRSFFKDGSNNSFHVGLDGNKIGECKNGTYGSWTWADENGTRISTGTISAGKHQLVLACREAHEQCLVDVICLTKSPSYIPSDNHVSFVSWPQPQIAVLSPNGSEELMAGSATPIIWATDTTKITNVVINLSVDGGISWQSVTGENSLYLGDANWENYPFTPTNEMVSTNCLIEVEKYEADLPEEQDASDAIFTIKDYDSTPVSFTINKGSISNSRSPVYLYDLKGAFLGKKNHIRPTHAAGCVISSSHRIREVNQHIRISDR